MLTLNNCELEKYQRLKDIINKHFQETIDANLTYRDATAVLNNFIGFVKALCEEGLSIREAISILELTRQEIMSEID